MHRFRYAAYTLLGFATALGAAGACTQDFDQFAPSGGFDTGSTSSGTTSGPTTSTTSGGGSGGAGGAGGAGPGGGGTGGAGPICGDGDVQGAEGCDDGNTAPADGCSATCTIENADACPGPAITLTTAGFMVQGDTTGVSADEGQLPCGGSQSGDLVYEITPTQNGTLTATLTGDFDTLLYVHNACPPPNQVEPVCSTTHGPATLTMPVLAGSPYYLFVDGFGNQTQEGMFMLTLALQ